MRRRLVINADDLGLSPEVNAGIVEALRRGCVSDTSVLMGAPFADEAVRELRRLGITHAGVHVDLDEVLGWSSPGREIIPRTALVRMLGQRSFMRRCEERARRQVEAFLSSGLEVTHIDTHHHVHGFLPVFELVVSLAKEYRVPAVRFSPHGYRLPTRQDICLDPATSRCMQDLLERSGIMSLDRMVEGARSILDDSGILLSGDTELVVHPSLGGDAWRAEEFNILTGEDIAGLLEKRGIALVSFRDVVRAA